MISENEIVSIDDIISRYNLTAEHPLVYGIYLQENPLLDDEERQNINRYMEGLIKKQKNINKINLNYIEQQKEK